MADRVYDYVTQIGGINYIWMKQKEIISKTCFSFIDIICLSLCAINHK